MFAFDSVAARLIGVGEDSIDCPFTSGSWVGEGLIVGVEVGSIVGVGVEVEVGFGCVVGVDVGCGIGVGVDIGLISAGGEYPLP